MQELAVDQAEDAAVVRIHRQRHMQIIATTALRPHDRRILDRQHRPAGAPLAGPPRRLLRHVLDANGVVAQEPAQPNLAGPAAPQTPHPQLPAAHFEQPTQQEGPPFSRRRSPSRPSANFSIRPNSDVPPELNKIPRRHAKSDVRSQ